MTHAWHFISHILVLLGWTQKGAKNTLGVWDRTVSCGSEMQPSSSMRHPWAAIWRRPAATRGHKPWQQSFKISQIHNHLIEARQCFVSHCHKTLKFSDLSLMEVVRLDFQFRPLALPKCHQGSLAVLRSVLWLAWTRSERGFFLLLLMALSTFKIFVVCLRNLSATSKLHWRQQLLMKAEIQKKADSYFLQAWRFPSVWKRKVSHKWKSVKETPQTTSCWG